MTTTSHLPATATAVAAEPAQSLVGLAQVLAETNAFYQIQKMGSTISHVPFLTSNVLYKRVTATVGNHYTAGGKFILGEHIGRGTQGTCYKVVYHPPGDSTHPGFPLVAKFMVVRPDRSGHLVLDASGIPRSIHNEFFIQKQFMRTPGVVHAIHAAELHHIHETPGVKQLTDWALFRGDGDVFKPERGDRLFLVCLPAYDCDFSIRLWAERCYFLSNGQTPPNLPYHFIPPPWGEGYLKLTVDRFYRLWQLLEKMHTAGHGHFDLLPKNLLVRQSQNLCEMDVCDFGQAKKFNSLAQLKSTDTAACYPPEGCAAIDPEESGVPHSKHLDRPKLYRQDYRSYDFYCLGYTLFDMLQTFFIHPGDFWNCPKWSVGGIEWLEKCHKRIEELSTTRVIKDLALAFLAKDKRYEKVTVLMSKYPTAEKLWAEHERELAGLPTPAGAHHKIATSNTATSHHENGNSKRPLSKTPLASPLFNMHLGL